MRFQPFSGHHAMKTGSSIVNALILFCLLVSLGCAYSGPGGGSAQGGTVQGSAVAADESGKQEVLDLLGEPAERRNLGGGNEEWIYYNVKKSLLADSAGSGARGGRKTKGSYDMIRITFGPFPGFVPTVWWNDFKKILGVPEPAVKPENKNE